MAYGDFKNLRERPDSDKILRDQAFKIAFNGRYIVFDGEGSCSFDNVFSGNVVILVLIIVHHLILIIKTITFQYQVKDQLLILMIAPVQQEKRLVLKQMQKFALKFKLQ